MTELAKKEITQSERFMLSVVKEFNSGVGKVALTDFQKRLAQNYFIAIDAVLKTSEEKRLKKSDEYRESLPYSWKNVNLEKLSRDVVAMARIGYDPAQKNHINLIPFKNNALQLYDIGIVEGYRGLELKAKKYGLDIPDNVAIEVVCANDRFKPIKKDIHNKIESYEFEIINAFDRGEIVGGFYYHAFSANPEKNKLVIMTLADIEKRKPDHASPEFWGGERDKWEYNSKTKKREKVGKEMIEGWYEKMVQKTIYRAAYADITIDSQKIDSDYLALKQMESDYELRAVEDEIDANANKTIIDVDYGDAPNDPTEDAANDLGDTVQSPNADKKFAVQPPDADKKANGPDF